MAVEYAYRKPAVAGMFYPSDRITLKEMVNKMLNSADTSHFPHISEPFGFISPHAGYIYSGGVAACGFRLLKDSGFKPELVIVIAPSHYTYFKGASVGMFSAYSTPLGDVKVARDEVDFLVENYEVFSFVEEAHLQEHSLEVQLPFLQVVLGEFKLIPVVVGDQRIYTVEAMADAFTDFLGKITSSFLIVASSDLSHYHSDDVAERLDSRVVDYVEKMDYRGLMKAVSSGECEACGAGTIATLLATALKLGRENSLPLCYAHSGMITGDRTRVVGYLSAVVW